MMMDSGEPQTAAPQSAPDAAVQSVADDFVAVCNWYQLQHAWKVSVSSGARVYMLDTSDYFVDAEDVVVDGTRCKVKAGDYAALGQAAQAVFSKYPDEYLARQTVFLCRDTIGVYLPALNLETLAKNNPFSIQLFGPAITTAGLVGYSNSRCERSEKIVDGIADACVAVSKVVDVGPIEPRYARYMWTKLPSAQ